MLSEKNPRKVRAGQAAMRKRWGPQRVLAWTSSIPSPVK